MHFVVWGAGTQGKYLKKGWGEQIIAYIDSDEKKVGSQYCGTKVISFASYMRDYAETTVVIGTERYRSVIKILEENHIFHYVLGEDLPTELRGYGRGDIHAWMAEKEFPEEKIYLYGLTAYTLNLYEMLSDRGKSVFMIPHRGVSPRTVEAFRKKYEHIIEPETLSGSDVQNVYLTIGEDRQVLDKLFPGVKLEDIYDVSEQILPHKYEKLERLKNTHSPDERCFLVATGPSLREEDLLTLRRNREFCISANGIFHNQARWIPDVYTVGDAKFLEENLADILNYGAKIKILSDLDLLKNIGDEPSDVYSCFVSRTRMQGLKFSEDIASVIYGGYTVMYRCIQIAVYLGFRNIYLLGVDCNYSSVNGKNHFYGNDAGFNDVVPDMLKSFETARCYAESHDIKIYNATRGGRLEVFPRVDFDSLF